MCLPSSGMFGFTESHLLVCEIPVLPSSGMFARELFSGHGFIELEADLNEKGLFTGLDSTPRPTLVNETPPGGLNARGWG